MQEGSTGQRDSSARGDSLFGRENVRGMALVVAVLFSFNAVGCAPTVSRGGAGTNNLRLDAAALSTGLDKSDTDYLVEQNLAALYQSKFWMKKIEGNTGDEPLFTIFPIKNDTTEHLENQMHTLLSSIETSLVNSGEVGVVSRERQKEMIQAVWAQDGEDFDMASAASLGKQLGAQY
jgi:hypothetical protein